MASDVVSLEPTVRVLGRTLFDEATAAKHTLHPRAVFALRFLERRIIYADWLRAVRRRLRPHEVAEILFFLSSIGGMRVERRFGNGLELGMFRSWHGVSDRLLWAPVRRYPANVSGVVRGVMSAGKFLLVLVPLTIACLWAVGLTWYHASLYAGLCYLLFLSSTMAHELVHCIWARQGQAVVLVRRLQIGVLHRQLPFYKEVSSAITGPITGAAVAMGVGTAGEKSLSLDYAFALGVLFGMAHVWSLMPWYGDGRVIKDKLIERVEKDV